MQPYSLLSIGPRVSMPQAQDPFAGWTIQPYQLNTAGNLPGNTTISVNGNGVQISGPTSSIILSDTTTLHAVMSLLGNKGYMLFADPTTGINNIIIGKLPDGTTGMVVSKPGVDVLTVFS
jgi:hypothetical protein